MQDIAVQRRERVDLFKKIFFYVKIGLISLTSILSGVILTVTTYIDIIGLKEHLGFGNFFRIAGEMFQWFVTADAAKYTMQFVAMGICSVIAGGFLAYIILMGIEKIVVSIMMRNANTGK